MQYYLVLGPQRKGPFQKDDLLAQGLEHDTLVWHTGRPDWVRADQLPDLRDLLVLVPPPIPDSFLAAKETSYRAEPSPRARADVSPLSRDLIARPCYRPATFRLLYGFWLLLLCLTLVPVLGAITMFILAANENPSTYRYNYVTGRSEYAFDYAARDRRDMFQILGILGSIGAMLLLLAGMILLLIFLYKAWNLVQDGRARTTPGRAIGFLLIPFFNLYWVFVVLRGLALELNRHAHRHEIRIKPVSEGLALTCCILALCCFVPPLAAVTLPAAVVMLVMLLNSVKNAAATIAEAKWEQARG